MKALILLATVLGSVAASAMEARVTCHPKAYSCRPGAGGYLDCAWSDVGLGESDVVRLKRDPRFPDRDRPYEVWTGRFERIFDGHHLVMHLRWTTESRREPVIVHATLRTPTVSAESSGLGGVDIRLRNDQYGRGFHCAEIEVL